MSFVLKDEAGAIATAFTTTGDKKASLRDTLALTVAVLTETERAYQSIATRSPDQWESLERSAATFTDEFVVKWLAENSPELKRDVTTQRRRKLSARAGELQLVESARDKRARWVAVTLPANAPIPIAEGIAEALIDATFAAEERLEQHLVTETGDPLLLAGQVVGLLSAAEVLLAVVPSAKVAAFCVQLARFTVTRERQL